jgi:hypothetical protein
MFLYYVPLLHYLHLVQNLSSLKCIANILKPDVLLSEGSVSNVWPEKQRSYARLTHRLVHKIRAYSRSRDMTQTHTHTLADTPPTSKTELLFF